MKKILSLITVTFLLSGCAESLALLGTTTSGASSGKITQSAISSAMSYGIKRETGKSPSQHALEYVQKHNPQSKKKKCIDFIDATNSETCAAIRNNISKTKETIIKAKKSILDKSKIVDLAKKSNLVRR